MKKIKSILVILLVCICLTAFSACGPEETQAPESKVAHSFIGNYSGSVAVEDTVKEFNSSILLNCNVDGTVDVYVAAIVDGVHQTANYNGTWQSQTNEDDDETISFTYKYGDGDDDSVSVNSAVILDSKFDASGIYITPDVQSAKLSFYQIAAIELTGDSYIGYLAKSMSMGLFIYAYVINLNADGTFTASVFNNMPFGGAVKGLESGTYEISGSEINFTYNVLADSDGDGNAESVLAGGENHVSTATDYDGNVFNGGLYIGQTTVTITPAQFIKL